MATKRRASIIITYTYRTKKDKAEKVWKANNGHKRNIEQTNTWENMEGGRLRRQGTQNQQQNKRYSCVITRRSFGAYILLGVYTSTAFYLGWQRVVSLTALEERDLAKYLKKDDTGVGWT